MIRAILEGGVAVKRTLIILALLIGANPVLAETRYVSDQLEITLRKGKSTQQKIIAMLKSGTPLEVLRVDEDAGYTKVKTTSGKTGWVLTRFLMREPSARRQLSSMKAKLASLELKTRQRQNQFGELESSKNSLQQNVTRLQNENRKLSRQLAEIQRTAASALAIDKENKTLKTRIVETERDLQAVRLENETLRDRTARDWFLAGAIVVIGSMLLGILLTRIRWKRKSNWDSL